MSRRFAAATAWAVVGGASAWVVMAKVACCGWCASICAGNDWWVALLLGCAC